MNNAGFEVLGQTDRIGLGVQYSVYGYGPDRVLKIPNSPTQTKRVIRGWKTGPKSSQALEAYLSLLIEDRALSVEFVDSRPELSSMTGNPVFDAESYTQDKAIPLQELFASDDAPKVERALDDYFALTYQQWRFGFADKAYNFASGYGINKKGELIMMDFGEITTDIKVAARDVESRVWLHRRSYLELLPDKYKPYFKQRSDELLTAGRLIEQWPESPNGYIGRAS
jgi:hypothetical protein